MLSTKFLPVLLLVGSVFAGSNQTKNLSALVEYLMAQPTSPWPESLVDIIGVPAGHSIRDFIVPRDSARDKVERSCQVVLAPKQKGGFQPFCLVFTTRIEDRKNRKSLSYIYKADLEGRLERAVEMRGEIDPSGEPIDGSGRDSTLDINSPTVRSAFQRELDLWIRGLYWKTPKKKSPNKIIAGDLAPSR